MSTEPGETRRPRGWRDPGLRAAWILAVVAAAGFAVIGLAWARGAGFAYVPQQSGSLVAAAVGLAMVGFGAGACAVQVGRRQDAVARRRMDRLVVEVTDLARRVADDPPRRRR